MRPALFLFCILFILTSCSKKVLAPTAPAISYEALPKRIQESTTLSIPITVQVAYLERMLNEQLGTSLYEDNSLDDNGGDNLELRVSKRGVAKLVAKGSSFDVTVPVHVWAKFGYRVDKFGVTVGKYEETAFDVDVRFLSTPSLAPDLAMSTQTISNGYTWITKPKVTIIGVDIPITAIVERVLDGQLPQVAKTIDQQIAKNFDLKAEAQKVWKLVQEPILINEAYRVWLKLVPQELTAYGPVGNGSRINMTIGLKMLAETHLGDKPVFVPISNIPPVQAAQAPGAFDIDMLSSIPWAECKRLAMAQVQGQTFVFQNGKRKVQVLDMDFSAEGGKMVVGLTLAGSITGKVYLKGMPTYDADKQTVYAAALEYDLHTRDKLARVADWMLHGTLLKRMEPYLNYSIAPQLLEGRNLIRQNLAANRIREDITVNGTLDAFAPKAIYTTPDGLAVVTHASGTFSLAVGQ